MELGKTTLEILLSTKEMRWSDDSAEEMFLLRLQTFVYVRGRAEDQGDSFYLVQVWEEVESTDIFRDGENKQTKTKLI